MKYILSGRTPVLCEDISQWGTWMENAERHVAKTEIGDVQISTVFLGLDHSFGSGPPILFETMIFGGVHHEYLKRYSTWEDAEEGHKRAVEFVKGQEANAPNRTTEPNESGD
jgi:hypothetical protein